MSLTSPKVDDLRTGQFCPAGPFDNEKRFEKGLFQVSPTDSLPLPEIREVLGRLRFVCLRGLVTELEVDLARQRLKARFRRSDDHPATGEPPSAVKGNYQKLMAGSVHSRHHEGSYARFVRTCYNSLFAPDIYGMHALFRRLIAVRNALLGKAPGFATDCVEDGVWTAARIHQYPVGGGFMGTHRDTTLSNIAARANLNYYQVLMTLSCKGRDYEKGGGYIEDEHGRLVLDDFSRPGDIIIYDGSSLHGVADIDPHRLLDLDSLNGRLAAFVSLYREL